MKVRLEFKLQDCWVGVYWRRRDSTLDIWICLIPCLPVRFTFGVEV